MNIQQGWRHHADLPLPGVPNLDYPKIRIRHRVHRGWTHGEDESNRLYIAKTNVLWDVVW